MSNKPIDPIMRIHFNAAMKETAAINASGSVYDRRMIEYVIVHPSFPGVTDGERQLGILWSTSKSILPGHSIWFDRWGTIVAISEDGEVVR